MSTARSVNRALSREEWFEKKRAIIKKQQREIMAQAVVDAFYCCDFCRSHDLMQDETPFCDIGREYGTVCKHWQKWSLL